MRQSETFVITPAGIVLDFEPVVLLMALRCFVLTQLCLHVNALDGALGIS